MNCHNLTNNKHFGTLTIAIFFPLLTRHGGGDEMVEIAVSGGGEFEGTEANIVKRLVVDTVSLVGVLDELMDG